MAGTGGLSGATRRALMGTALTATLLLTACGSSSGSKSAATQPSTAAASSASAGASSAPAASTPATSAAKAPTGDSGSSFCQKARDESAAEAKDTAALTSNDPTSLKKFEEAAIKQLPAFVSSAPSQIKSAVQTLAAGDESIFNALEKANFDFTKLPANITTQFTSPTFEAATTKVADYLQSVCGIQPDTGIPSSAG